MGEDLASSCEDLLDDAVPLQRGIGQDLAGQEKREPDNCDEFHGNWVDVRPRVPIT